MAARLLCNCTCTCEESDGKSGIGGEGKTGKGRELRGSLSSLVPELVKLPRACDHIRCLWLVTVVSPTFVDRVVDVVVDLPDDVLVVRVVDVVIVAYSLFQDCFLRVVVDVLLL